MYLLPSSRMYRKSLRSEPLALHPVRTETSLGTVRHIGQRAFPAKPHVKKPSESEISPLLGSSTSSTPAPPPLLSTNDTRANAHIVRILCECDTSQRFFCVSFICCHMLENPCKTNSNSTQSNQVQQRAREANNRVNATKASHVRFNIRHAHKPGRSKLTLT